MTLQFNTEHPFADMTELRISDSSLNGGYKSCARKLEFRKFYNVPGSSRSLAGDVGNALHAGWQNYVVTNDKQAAMGAMMLAYPIDLNSNPSDYRSLEACYATLNKMFDSTHLIEYEIAQIKCLDGITRPAVEVPFLIKIKNFSLSDEKVVPVHYIGFIDLILKHRIDESFIVVDIKTHRQNADDMTPKYMYDEQCIPYGLILERILGHDLEGFFTWYYSVYVDITKPRVKVYKFPKNQYDIRDWARGFYNDLETVKRFYNAGWFPRSGKSCMNFNKPCEFFDICNSRDKSVIEQYILSNFKSPSIDRFKGPWIEVELELAA